MVSTPAKGFGFGLLDIRRRPAVYPDLHVNVLPATYGSKLCRRDAVAAVLIFTVHKTETRCASDPNPMPAPAPASGPQGQWPPMSATIVGAKSTPPVGCAPLGTRPGKCSTSQKGPCWFRKMVFGKSDTHLSTYRKDVCASRGLSAAFAAGRGELRDLACHPRIRARAQMADRTTPVTTPLHGKTDTGLDIHPATRAKLIRAGVLALAAVTVASGASAACRVGQRDLRGIGGRRGSASEVAMMTCETRPRVDASHIAAGPVQACCFILWTDPRLSFGCG